MYSDCRFEKLFRFAKQDYHNGALIKVAPALDRPSFFKLIYILETKQTTFMHGASDEDTDQPDYCKFGTFREGFIFVKLRGCGVSRK